MEYLQFRFEQRFLFVLYGDQFCCLVVNISSLKLNTFVFRFAILLKNNGSLDYIYGSDRMSKGKLGTYVMKRVPAGAHLPTPWLFEPAKRPDDRADCCLDCSLCGELGRKFDFVQKYPSIYHVDDLHRLEATVHGIGSRSNK